MEDSYNILQDTPKTNGVIELINSDHSDDDIFTQRLNTEIAKTEKQSRLVKRKNKISFTTSKKPKNSVAKTIADAEQISLIMENILLIDLMNETRQKKKNLMEFSVFWDFMCHLISDPKTDENLMPIPVIIVLHFLMIQTPTWEKIDAFSRQTIISNIFDADAVQLTSLEEEIARDFRTKN